MDAKGSLREVGDVPGGYEDIERMLHMRAGRDELAVEFEQEGLAVKSARWGEMHIARYTLPPGTDLTPFFAALPDGLCSGDHYGVVLEGDITISYRDGSEEPAEAGDVFYWPGGHTGWTERGVDFVAVTPLVQQEEIEQRIAAATG